MDNSITDFLITSDGKGGVLFTGGGEMIDIDMASGCIIYNESTDSNKVYAIDGSHLDTSVFISYTSYIGYDTIDELCNTYLGV